MIRALGLIAASLTLMAAFVSAASAYDNLTEQRIAAVEQGLDPPYVIAGELAKSWTIAMQMHRLRVPAVSVAVIDNYKIDWTRAWGVTQPGGNAAAKADTVFQAASISKAVSAMAIMRLVENGKLNLDANVNEYLKTWRVPANRFTQIKPVTMRELLSHCSGATVHGFPGYEVGVTLPALTQILDGVAPANSAPVRIISVPGTEWQYSGGGYEIAEQVVDDVTSEPFATFMRTTLLQPLAMDRSTFDQPLPETLSHSAASGTQADGSAVVDRWHVYPEHAAAGLWTTAADLARFAIELMNARRGAGGAVLSQGAAAQMLMPTIQTSSGFDQALGVATRTVDGDLRFYKDGANAGFRAMLIGSMSGRGVVVMTNSDNGMALALEIVRAVERVYRWPKESPSLPEI